MLRVYRGLLWRLEESFMRVMEKGLESPAGTVAPVPTHFLQCRKERRRMCMRCLPSFVCSAVEFNCYSPAALQPGLL